MSSHAVTEHHHDANGTDVFGFWLYILTDCILFGSIFAVFIVMNQPGAFGPELKKFIDLPYVLIETAFLLASNLTYGMGMLALYQKKKTHVQIWLALTLLLGLGFVGMEVNEFINLIHEGFSPQISGVASAFFTLVGTHGFHVSCGLIWILVMFIQFMFFNVNEHTERRMTMLGIFWNFLDIVWIFVFSVVYLTGAL